MTKPRKTLDFDMSLFLFYPVCFFAIYSFIFILSNDTCTRRLRAVLIDEQLLDGRGKGLLLLVCITQLLHRSS
jgi:hypothetical protein